MDEDARAAIFTFTRYNYYHIFSFIYISKRQFNSRIINIGKKNE